jgi:hypothetical protein
MPHYDCGRPECTECQRSFGPDRSKAIKRFRVRENSHHFEAHNTLNDLFDDLDGRLGEFLNGSLVALQTSAGWKAETAVFEAAKQLITSLRNLDDARREEADEDDREARLEGGHNYLSMQQLGVSPGRTAA